MIKCPYCPNAEFSIGNIKIGENGSSDVIYCTKCEKIISILEKTLKKPYDATRKSGATTLPLRP